MLRKKVVKTLYLCDGKKPIRLDITQTILDRTREIQQILKSFKLRRNEFAQVEITYKNVKLLITKHFIDIGRYEYDGWYSFIPEMTIQSLDDLPEVSFTQRFKTAFACTGVDLGVWKMIKPKHRTYIVWKKIEGDWN